MTPVSRRALLGSAALGAAACSVGLGTVAQAAPTSSTITPGDPYGPGTDLHTRKFDLRAMWIATVTNIDFPSKRGLTADQMKAELIAWLDLAQRSNHNAVVYQVRPTADTFWPSALEPWSHWLTGTQGKDPGFDPLQFCIDEAHARGLEVHAWYNPFRVAMDEAGAALIPTHPARVHPDWTIPYGGKLYYNPGVPEARQHSIDVIMESVRAYDIDAVHFDDYFYPYPVAGVTFHDEEQYAQYGNGMSLADWRRSNIDDLVLRLGAAIKQAKPEVQFGVSPFAVWRNVGTDPEGSQTTAGAQTYDDLYADTRKWVREGWIDYITPQIYWSLTLAAAEYDKVAEWWLEQCEGRNVHLYIGQATYKVALNFDPPWSDPQELNRHLEWNAQYGERIGGNMYFSAKDVRANRLDATAIVNATWYSRPALTPRSPWLDAVAPSAPQKAWRLPQDRINVLYGSSDTNALLIYRVPAGVTPTPEALADARHLEAIVPAVPNDGEERLQTITLPAGSSGDVYYVSAADRLSNESAAVRVR
ncbi:glycoside hydrolase family 10 protein [Aestuariimicrobium soli]|uniref:glycoside hydrolase family 10 protein n=1 Tax=Aestuariimicrobium soli TaxID=2035834 RepID=UPI003EB810F3